MFVNRNSSEKMVVVCASVCELTGTLIFSKTIGGRFLLCCEEVMNTLTWSPTWSFTWSLTC